MKGTKVARGKAWAVQSERPPFKSSVMLLVGDCEHATEPLRASIFLFSECKY